MQMGLEQLETYATRLGAACRGGECFELIGDVGTGKTTFTKALARGLAVDEDVQSPSFTISREYEARDGLHLAHYDFYRLPQAGVTGSELAESVARDDTVTVIEWAETVHDVLPTKRVRITFSYMPTVDDVRELDVAIPEQYEYLKERL